MATIQRNIKTYGNRNFVAEVASAPANYAPILSNEVDADLDTIYAAWNGGTDSVNLKDGSVTYAKLAPDAQLWRDTGTSLTPGTNFATRPIVAWPGDASGATVLIGTTTGKVRLQTAASLPAGGGGLFTNRNWLSGNAQDDATQPSWGALLSGSDSFLIQRSAAGSVASADLMKVDATGQVTLLTNGANNPVIFGVRTIKGRLVSHPGANDVFLTCNNALSPGSTWVKDDTSKAGWGIQLDCDGDQLLVTRAAPAGSPGVVCTITNGGAVIAGTHLQPTGASAGLRCQNVGTASGDGYSNAVAFGWDGTLKARIDGTVIGTVTVTSDARLKLDVQADVPGLDAVLALRPISFAYDQTKREIGFPKGRHYGLIAQDVEPHAPLVVEADDSDDHWLELDYRLLVPVLIRAIQELAQKVGATA